MVGFLLSYLLARVINLQILTIFCLPFLQDKPNTSQGAGLGKSIANFFKNIGRDSKENGRMLSADLQRSSSSASYSSNHLKQQSLNQLPPIGDAQSSNGGSSRTSPRLGISSEMRLSSSTDGVANLECQENGINDHHYNELLFKSLEQLK